VNDSVRWSYSPPTTTRRRQLATGENAVHIGPGADVGSTNTAIILSGYASATSHKQHYADRLSLLLDFIGCVGDSTADCSHQQKLEHPLFDNIEAADVKRNGLLTHRRSPVR
ncbi:hypothetical protein LSAT2_015156, partial [Lamellibrachia satsuma]